MSKINGLRWNMTIRGELIQYWQDDTYRRANGMNEQQRAIFDGFSKLTQGMVLAKIKDPTMTDHEAYMVAGGTAKSYDAQRAGAYEILTNPHVRNFIAGYTTERITTSIISRERMLEGLSVIAESSITDVMDLVHVDDELMNTSTGELFTDIETVSIKKLSDIKPEHRRLIKSIKNTKYGVEVTLHDPIAAQKMIAEMCGYNAPTKQEITGRDGGPIEHRDVPDEALEQKLKELGLGRYHNQLSGKVVDGN
jgi:phage terminase small subunit